MVPEKLNTKANTEHTVNKERVNLVLETLSFFEPMSLDKIILDFDKSVIEKMPDFTSDELEKILKYLEKKGKVKKIHLEKSVQYIKVQKRVSKLKRIFSFLNYGKRK